MEGHFSTHKHDTTRHGHTVWYAFFERGVFEYIFERGVFEYVFRGRRRGPRARGADNGNHDFNHGERPNRKRPARVAEATRGVEREGRGVRFG